jgi:hypothetical protein
MAATKAPLFSGGMTHCLFCHGFSSFFFQRPADGLVTNRVDDPELHKLVGQHLHRPAAAPSWRRRASYGDELCLLLAVKLWQPVTLGFGSQSTREALFGATLLNSLHGHLVAFDRFSDFAVGQRRAMRAAVGLEQNASVHEFWGGSLPG